MLMVAEMTGSIGLLAPAMVASALLVIVGRSDDSIYRSQLRTRDDSPASRLRFGLPLLATLKVSDVARPPGCDLAGRGPRLRSLQALPTPGSQTLRGGRPRSYVVRQDRSASKRSLLRAPRPDRDAMDTTTATVLPRQPRCRLEALSKPAGPGCRD